MYESPIEIFTQTSDVVKQLQEQQDNYVYQCVLNVGVNVDKEELIRALKYDRDQYSKGYDDGIKEFAERLKGRTTTAIFGQGKYSYNIITEQCIDNLVNEMTQRDDSKKVIKEEYGHLSMFDNEELFAVKIRLKTIPTADVVEVKHGEWITDEDGVVICSECGEEHEWQDFRPSYCDMCGSKNKDGRMKGGAE